MKYILDTQILLWYTDGIVLSDKMVEIIESMEHDVCISIVSLWEMSIKQSIGKLKIDMEISQFYQTYCRDYKIELLNLELKHLDKLKDIPFHHKDPFDRVIIAQSISENIPVISSDKTFDFYPIKRIYL